MKLDPGEVDIPGSYYVWVCLHYETPYILVFHNKQLRSGLLLSIFVGVICLMKYRSRTVNSNTVNSKFHLIRSFCEMFSYHSMFKVHG